MFCSNIIKLFSLSLNFLDPDIIDCQSFLFKLFFDFIVFRKYYLYIKNKIYRLNTNCINQQNYSRVNFYLLCYYICVNSIRNLKLVSNESLMNIMKKIDEIDLKCQEIYAQHQSNQNSNDTEENKNVINENKSEILKKVKLTTKNL